MTVMIERLMAQGVVVASPDQTVDYVKRQMQTLDIHTVPVADAEGHPVGIVRSRELLFAHDGSQLVSEVMCKEVVTADRRDDVGAVAALMRRNRQRQAVVTERGKIVGIVSAYDFLELVDGRSYQAKRSAKVFETGVFHLADEMDADDPEGG